MTSANRVQVAMSSRPENVGVARLVVASLAAHAGFSVAELEEIKVSVSEAVTNAVVHGYGGDPGGTIWLEVAVDEAGLLISVIDRGRGIANLEQARRPAFSSNNERMGLGFTFMENFMDGLEVDSQQGKGTQIRMHKRLGSGRDAAAGTA